MPALYVKTIFLMNSYLLVMSVQILLYQAQTFPIHLAHIKIMYNVFIFNVFLFLSLFLYCVCMMDTLADFMLHNYAVKTAHIYMRCTTKNVPFFRRTFFRLNCIDIIKYTYIHTQPVIETVTRQLLKNERVKVKVSVNICSPLVQQSLQKMSQSK
jgi:hypothetical protein